MNSEKFKFRHSIQTFHLYYKWVYLQLFERKTVLKTSEKTFWFCSEKVRLLIKNIYSALPVYWSILISNTELLSFYFYSLCLNWDPHSLLLSFNNLRVTWRAFVWETFQAKPRQQFRECFLFVDKNILKQPRELLLFHIIIFNVSLDMYEMPFSSCGRINFFTFLQHVFC